MQQAMKLLLFGGPFSKSLVLVCWWLVFSRVQCKHSIVRKQRSKSLGKILAPTVDSNLLFPEARHSAHGLGHEGSVTQEVQPSGVVKDWALIEDPIKQPKDNQAEMEISTMQTSRNAVKPVLVQKQGSTSTACVNAHIGAIHVVGQPGKCLDPKGDNGQGDISKSDCNQKSDQQWIYCGDGSIRNSASTSDGYCLGTTGSNGLGDVSAQRCIIDPFNAVGPEQDQIWIKTDISIFQERSISQTSFRLENSKSGRCLHIRRRRKRAVVQNSCDEEYQEFYFRARGSDKFSGQLINHHDQQCMDAGSDGAGNVRVEECKGHDENRLQQNFTWYENGEIRSEQTQKCLHAKDDGDVHLQNCDGGDKQIWDSPQTESSQMQFILNKTRDSGSIRCLAINDGGDVRTKQCSDGEKEFWDFSVASIQSSGRWVLRGNVQAGGGISTERCSTDSTTRTEETSHEVAVSLRNMYSTGIFGGSEFEVSVSYSLGLMFSNSWTQESSTCETRDAFCEHYYEDDAPVTQGLLWQWVVDYADETSYWRTSYFECTKRGSVDRKSVV